jgi:hypothetical protein
MRHIESTYRDLNLNFDYAVLRLHYSEFCPGSSLPDGKMHNSCVESKKFPGPDARL